MDSVTDISQRIHSASVSQNTADLNSIKEKWHLTVCSPSSLFYRKRTDVFIVGLSCFSIVLGRQCRGVVFIITKKEEQTEETERTAENGANGAV